MEESLQLNVVDNGIKVYSKRLHQELSPGEQYGALEDVAASPGLYENNDRSQSSGAYRCGQGKSEYEDYSKSRDYHSQARSNNDVEGKRPSTIQEVSDAHMEETDCNKSSIVQYSVYNNE